MHLSLSYPVAGVLLKVGHAHAYKNGTAAMHFFVCERDPTKIK